MAPPHEAHFDDPLLDVSQSTRRPQPFAATRIASLGLCTVDCQDRRGAQSSTSQSDRLRLDARANAHEDRHVADHYPREHRMLSRTWAGIALVFAAAVLGLAPKGLMAQGRAAELDGVVIGNPVLTRTSLRPSFVIADFSVTQGGTAVLPTGATCTASFAGDKAYGIRRYEGRFGRGLVRCAFAFNNARYLGQDARRRGDRLHWQVRKLGRRAHEAVLRPHRPWEHARQTGRRDRQKQRCGQAEALGDHPVARHLASRPCARRAWTAGMEHVAGPSIDAVTRRHEDRSAELGATGLLGRDVFGRVLRQHALHRSLRARHPESSRGTHHPSRPNGRQDK